MLVHGERNCGIMLSGCDKVKQYGSEMEWMWWVHLVRFGDNISVDFAKNWFDKFGRESLAKWSASLAEAILPDCCNVHESVDSKRVATGGECGARIDVKMSGGLE
jgi:hypothetical protein